MRKSSIIYILFFILSCPFLNGQSPNLIWAKRTGGTQSSNAKNLVVDINGNILKTGYFSGTVDFDPGSGTFNLTSSGQEDVFVYKLNSSGNLIWARKMGGSKSDKGVDIKVDKNGNVYIIGVFTGTVDFNPGSGFFYLTSNSTSSLEYSDVFVTKLDGSGNFIWAKQIDGISQDYASQIEIDSNDNIYILGSFGGIIDLNPGPEVFNFNSTIIIGPESFLTKWNSDGVFIYGIHFSYSGFTNMVVDFNGNVIITGTFSGTKDFDPGTGIFNLTSSNNDVFVFKINSSGIFNWAKKFGGSTSDFANSISVDINGNLYLTGMFAGPVDFDPGSGVYMLGMNITTSHIFILKLNSSGNFLWAKEIGNNTAGGYGGSIALDNNNNVYTTGSIQPTNGTIDLDPGPNTYNLFSSNTNISYISKLNSSGNFVSACLLEAPYNWSKIFVDNNENIYLSGIFNGTVDFDPGSGVYNLTSAGGNNVFVAKFDQSAASCTPPSTPTGLAATPFSSSQINLSWNAVSGAIGYDIYYCDGTYIGFTPNTTYNHTGRVASTTYSYKIAAQKSPTCVSPQTSCVNATTLNPSSNPVPIIITSPLPSVVGPGLFQSNLPDLLYNASIPMTNCIQPFKCFEVFQNPSQGMTNNTTAGELIPYAANCFTSLNNNWAFRQRGYITRYNGEECNTISQCATTTQSKTPAVTHSQNACWDKDDRYAWDITLLDNKNEIGISVYAVEKGVVKFSGNHHLGLEHTNNSGEKWYSWYDNIDLEPGIGINTTVIKNQHIADIQDREGPHLHFGVYYKDGNGKLISVNRQIQPDYINDITGNPYTISNLTGTITGSIVSGSRIFFKKENKWYNGGVTDENGRFNFVTIPGLNAGDSMKVIASGYEKLEFELDLGNIQNINLKIPLMKDNSNIGVMNPSFKPLSDSTFYKSPTILLKISGTNFNTFDIIKIVNTDDSEEYFPLSLGHSYLDSVVNITLRDTGINNIGVLFNGADTVLVTKLLSFLPLITNSYSVLVTSPSHFLNTKMYVNGQYVKDILQTTENILLDARESLITFTKSGFLDTTYIINSNTTINLTMQSIPQSFYSILDSSIVNFPVHGKIQYRRNVTMLDSAQKSVISLKQVDDSFSGKGLLAKSRKFEFSHLNTPTWSSIKTAMVLDQITNLSVDSIYLMRIFNDTTFKKITFDKNGTVAGYDSLVQKLSYNYINFDSGRVKKEALVIMKKQAPILKINSTINANQISSFQVPLSQLFSDPDSIKNDMIFEIINPTPTGMSLSISNGNIVANINSCFSGNTSFTIKATHDGLAVNNTVNVSVNSLTAQPSTITGNNNVLLSQTLDYTISTITGATGYNWVLSGGGNITSGQNSNTATIYWTTAGDYTLTVNGINACGNGPTQSFNIKVSVGTGIVNPDDQFQIKLVPNPSPGEFYLTAKGLINKKIKIDVFNNLGQTVFQTEQRVSINDYYKMFDLKKLSEGIYIIRIYLDNKYYSRRVIKLN